MMKVRGSRTPTPPVSVVGSHDFITVCESGTKGVSRATRNDVDGGRNGGVFGNDRRGWGPLLAVPYDLYLFTVG